MNSKSVVGISLAACVSVWGCGDNGGGGRERDSGSGSRDSGVTVTDAFTPTGSTDSGASTFPDAFVVTTDSGGPVDAGSAEDAPFLGDAAFDDAFVPTDAGSPRCGAGVGGGGGVVCGADTECCGGCYCASTGECEPSVCSSFADGGTGEFGCIVGSPGACPAGQYCAGGLFGSACGTFGSCQAAGGFGCGSGGEGDFPVCGCDGADYASVCAAHLAGTEVATFGACTPATANDAGPSTGSNFFSCGPSMCDRRSQYCQTGGFTGGACVPYPEECTATPSCESCFGVPGGGDSGCSGNAASGIYLSGF